MCIHAHTHIYIYRERVNTYYMQMSLVPSFSGSKAVVPGLIRRVHFLAPLYCRALLQSGDSPLFAVKGFRILKETNAGHIPA